MGTPNSNQHNPFVTQHPTANQANKSVSLIWEPQLPKPAEPPCHTAPSCKSSKQKRISNMGTPNSNQHNSLFSHSTQLKQANKSVSVIWEPPTATSTTPFFTQQPNASQANKSVSPIWEPPTPTSTTPFVTQHPTQNKQTKAYHANPQLQPAQPPLSHSTQLQIKQTKAYL